MAHGRGGAPGWGGGWNISCKVKQESTTQLFFECLIFEKISCFLKVLAFFESCMFFDFFESFCIF